MVVLKARICPTHFLALTYVVPGHGRHRLVDELSRLVGELSRPVGPWVSCVA